MRVTLLRLLLPVLLLPLMAQPVARAEDQFEPQATERPVAYLPLVIRSTGSSSQPTTETVEQQVVTLTNALRAAAGCPPLTVSPELTAAARSHSRDMAENDFFSHTGSDGSSAFDRIKRSGYTYRMAAENIAAGYSDAQSVVDGWYNSPGHRANMLNCELREIGVGHAYIPGTAYGHYWTQDFGTR